MGRGDLETVDSFSLLRFGKYWMLKDFRSLCSALAAWSMGVVELVLEETDFDIKVAPGKLCCFWK